HRLRSVDADVANRVLVAVRHRHVDRVPVDDAGHLGADRAGWLRRAALVSAATRDRERDQNSGNEEGCPQGATAQRSAHPSMMLRASELFGDWRVTRAMREESHLAGFSPYA